MSAFDIKLLFYELYVNLRMATLCPPLYDPFAHYPDNVSVRQDNLYPPQSDASKSFARINGGSSLPGHAVATQDQLTWR